MKIQPLSVFEADADPHNRDALTDAEAYARLEPPKTIVVKFGSMGLIGEYTYGGDAKPGCGTKMVARTHRGTELTEMLTTTCDNSGCTKSISRNEMMTYIEDSGGKDYPFFKNGRVLRVATIEDLNEQSGLETIRKEAVAVCKKHIAELDLDMKLVEAEPILGGELLTYYYMAEDRVDFRELVQLLAAHFKARIEMRQVGARDEARLVADYERCGQHCCCKTFLKVLKPVSMRAAKLQKATLDPLKISGRCGRLMCCLRYEDESYRELKSRLPHKKTRVGTSEGPGTVVDSKILVQLVLVRLEHDEREIAVPVEELLDPDECPSPAEAAARKEAQDDPLRGMEPEQVEEQVKDKPRKGRRRRRRGRGQRQEDYRKRSETEQSTSEQPAKDGAPQKASATGSDQEGRPKRRRRRRGRRGRGGKGSGGDGKGSGSGGGTPSAN
jgi:cell fate regulator YaaT (PSP1 superfamily)